MKNRLVLFALSTGLICCRNQPTEVISLPKPPIVSYSVGNQYVYEEWFNDSSHIVDCWRTDTITNSVMIGSTEWYRFEDGVIRTADSSRVYVLRDSVPAVELDYSLSVGDSLQFNGLRYLVGRIATERVLGESERVFHLTNDSISVGTTWFLAYATRFGLNWTVNSSGQLTNGSRLVAAFVLGKWHGDSTYFKR